MDLNPRFIHLESVSHHSANLNKKNLTSKPTFASVLD